LPVILLGESVTSPAPRACLLYLDALGETPAARVHELEQQLAALTRGEGVLLECAFDRYEAVRGTIPTRPRSDKQPHQPQGIPIGPRERGCEGPRTEIDPSDEWLFRRFGERAVPSGKGEIEVRVCQTFLGFFRKMMTFSRPRFCPL
jgi:hypothetical protein